MNVTDYWDGWRVNPDWPRYLHECFQGSYLSQGNNYCSIGRLIVQHRGGIETNGWGSRRVPDVWDAYRDYYPGLPIWESFFGTYLYQNLDRFAGGMGRLLISNRGGSAPETIGSRYRTICTQ